MNSKLREALKRIMDAIKSLSKTHSSNLPQDVKAVLGDMAFTANEALAEPVRNCDVGTAEEQDERFKNFCLSHYEPCNVDGECWRCPLFKTKTRCPIAWEQMPYESEVTK